MTGGPPTTSDPPEGSPLELWWKSELWARRQRRLEREAEDPGTPMWYGTATGDPSWHPWSAVLGARERLHRVLNLDRLRRRVLELLGVKP